MERHPTALAATLAIAGLVMTACGSSATGSSTGDGSGRVDVVASTDVWGDVVRAVGGDDVSVTSIISEPDQDPHSYEASASTLLALARADVVIENGGGYDDFVGRMLSTGKSEATVLDAVRISGKQAPSGGELNEHVWYDLPSVDKVARAVADELGRLRPRDRSAFESRADTFTAEVADLQDREAAMKRRFGGDKITITEPVPLYLTAACGLVNATPPAFSEAVEEGDDVSPAVLQETLDLYSQRKVAALVYNEQTSGPVTEKVLDAARSAGVPVVPVTETLPSGEDYLGWMSRNLSHLKAALSSR